jgi:diguanylate cyclase (GGDEF)-like protein/PAS domain S-box-containing protein
MHRLLLIESSPTLRRGIERLLRSHGFDVFAVAADEGCVDVLSQELSRGLDAVVLGWTTASDALCHALSQRLRAADAQPVAVLVLAADPAFVDASLALERPHTLVTRLQRPSEVPRLLRGLLAEVARTHRAHADAPAPLNVLLVDDSRTSRTKYQRLLRSHGYAVVACEDAVAALEAVKGARFDLAIVDYYMPGMNGAMLCRALREMPATRELTLAVLTGSYEDGLISDCLEAGAMECMFKNESNELFLARVHSMARLRERELKLKDEGQRLELILASVGDGVYGVDRSGRITFVNPAALRLLQCAHEDELVGLSAHARIHHSDARSRPVPAETCFLQQAYELGDSLSSWETVFWGADGQPISVECTVRPQHHAGECVGVVVAFRDIAERKRFDAEMEWQLHHDHLTQLHNRRHFEDMLEQEIFRLRRSAEQSALLFIDLDRFKHINDSAGHAAGDALLATIGHKLKARSRQSDLVARLGGDEFAVLLRNVDDGKVLALAEKFRAILDEMRFSHGGREFEVSGSVGICALNRHTLSPAYAMNCADAACQVAKRQGRNRFHRFDISADASSLAALQQSWAERLKLAIVGGHFALQFQPMLDLKAGSFPDDDILSTAPCAYEVFLRLDDVDARLAPRAFLAQAERFDLLPELDLWVLERMAALLHERRPAAHTRFHLNVSLASLQHLGYRARLSQMLRERVFSPGQLCLEIKESEVTSHIAALLPALQELSELGVGLMLDEYGGRGFGGMDVLRSLPLSSVKLDGNLVQTLPHDAIGPTLLRALVDLAHAMKLVVIAPLVEDADTLRLLYAAGVDCAQGFVLGVPDDEWKRISPLAPDDRRRVDQSPLSSPS